MVQAEKFYWLSTDFRPMLLAVFPHVEYRASLLVIGFQKVFLAKWLVYKPFSSTQDPKPTLQHGYIFVRMAEVVRFKYPDISS
ncbi:hypothetical protein CEXT_372431 [Caerostris extrusa]|uniref:Uncharacterized protein n=1 Tax=Caerostris extrusa TaxID=172846 RepID=A0AAV4XX29_CAEEX|nr:hypothetical protein CEXT_372431 [Caerostris extrusa]